MTIGSMAIGRMVIGSSASQQRIAAAHRSSASQQRIAAAHRSAAAKHHIAARIVAASLPPRIIIIITDAVASHRNNIEAPQRINQRLAKYCVISRDVAWIEPTNPAMNRVEVLFMHTKCWIVVLVCVYTQVVMTFPAVSSSNSLTFPNDSLSCRDATTTGGGDVGTASEARHRRRFSL
jgi:hypothetical protein